MKLALILLFLLSTVSGQFGSCEDFQGSPSLCNGLFLEKVWVPPGYNQFNLSTTLINRGFLASVLLPGECARMVTIVSCSLTFRSCGENQLPLPLCPDICFRANEVCAEVDSFVPFNCSEIDPVFGSSLWSIETNRTGTLESCQMANATVPQISCPYPFIENPLLDQCSLKCPPTGIDNRRVNDAIFTIIRVLAPIAILLELFIIPPLWFQHTVSMANKYIVYWWICQLMASICDIFGKWLTWEDYICQDAWTVRTQSSTICALGAIGPFGFRNSSVTWIAIITYMVLTRFDGWSSFRLFGNLGRFEKINESLVFHILAWVPPFMGMIIAYSNGWIKNGGAFGCYVLTDVADGWAANILALIPLTIGTAASTLFMVLIINLIIRSSWQIAIQQWRILFLSIIYTIVVLIVIIFSWVTFHQDHEIKRSISQYLTCIALTGSAEFCPRLNNPLNTNFQIVSITFSVGVPIVSSIAFINRNTFNFWRTTFSKESLIELTMNSGKTQSSHSQSI